MPPIGTILFGLALVIDGDTLAIDGDRLRLQGIDAPELGQQCERQDVSYACGVEAAAYLGRLLERQQAICTIRSHEGDIAIANCIANGRDLAQDMLEAGWAFATPRSSRQHMALEQAARAQKIGLWAGTAEPPWQWRLRQK